MPGQSRNGWSVGCLGHGQSGIDVSKTEESWNKMLDNLSIVIAKSIK